MDVEASGDATSAELQERLRKKDQELKQALSELEAIKSARSYKFMTKLWHWRRRVFPEGTLRNELYTLCILFTSTISSEGPVSAVRQTSHYLMIMAASFFSKAYSINRSYQAWMERNEPGPEEFPRLQKEAEAISYKPLFSIVLMTAGRDSSWHRAALESVRQQIYPHWQLCLPLKEDSASDSQPILDKDLQDRRVKIIRFTEKQDRGRTMNAALESTTGEFICIIGQDCELAPWALLEIARTLNVSQETELFYTDEDVLNIDGSRREPFFKPGFSPDLLMGMNYIGRFIIICRKLIEEIGGFRDEFPGAEEYDLIVRAAERARKVARIPKVLYHVRELPREARYDATTKQSSQSAQAKVIEDALSRRGRPGKVEQLTPSTFKVMYVIEGNPLVSIIIPAKNKAGFTKRCIGSIEKKSTYRHFEIIVVDNGSTQLAAKKYLDSIRGKPNRLVLDFPEAFNYSRMNNFAAKHARGDFLLFLNNDTEVITRDWLEEMIGYAQHKEVGAVGVKLLYPNRRVQHGGVILGIGETACHAFYGMRKNDPGYMRLASVVRNCSAVTAACMMVRRCIFKEVGGFDETFLVAFSDVDVCMKLLEKGFFNVYTPFSLLRHYEGKTRGRYYPNADTLHFIEKWRESLNKCDPFYNPNLSSTTDHLMEPRAFAG